jgi:hypothetical protein
MQAGECNPSEAQSERSSLEGHCRKRPTANRVGARASKEMAAMRQQFGSTRTHSRRSMSQHHWIKHTALRMRSRAIVAVDVRVQPRKQHRPHPRHMC